MGSVPKPHRVDIDIDDLMVADGKVDRWTVAVHVRWRASASTSPFSRGLSEKTVGWMRSVGQTDLARFVGNLVSLELPDGRGTLVPREYATRVLDDCSMAEWYRDNYEKCLRLPIPTAEIVEWARGHVRDVQPDFDDHPAENQAAFLKRTLKKMLFAILDLEAHLEHAGPQKGNARPPMLEPERAVRAAVLRDVLDRTPRQIRRHLEIKKQSGLKQPSKNGDANAETAIHHGRGLLVQAFGSEGWRSEKEHLRRMRGWRQRCTGILRANGEPREQFYLLLAETLGTTAARERARAMDDGLDERLAGGVDAHHEDDFERLSAMADADPRIERVQNAIFRAAPAEWLIQATERAVIADRVPTQLKNKV